jgi:hypothetical protein
MRLFRNRVKGFRQLLIILILTAIGSAPAQRQLPKVRIALFNIWELSTDKLLNVDEEGRGLDRQLLAAAKIIQKIKADVLVINEIDHDYNFISKGLNLNLFRFMRAYLRQGDTSIAYSHVFTAPCNTGIPTGLDLNKDGVISSEQNAGDITYGADCFGFGNYPGQYAMGLYSKYPIDTSQVKTFQKFLWKDLPGNHIPPNYYDEEALNIFRLSSKSHWDVPIMINGKKLHLLLSHPTPPSFDGDEDSNGRRNFDEIKFWVNYLADDKDLYDDNNIFGGLNENHPFLIAGDLNASKNSESRYDNMVAIDQLLNHPKITDTGKWLVSKGGWEGRKEGPPDYWERNTAKFGNDNRMRIDYLLPDKSIQIAGGGVYWPASVEDPAGHMLAETASDHRLVWIDIIIP